MIVANRVCQAYPLKWNSEVFPVDKWPSPLLELAHSKIENAMQNDKTYRKHVKCQNIIYRLTKWNSIQHHNRICIGIKAPITFHREELDWNGFLGFVVWPCWDQTWCVVNLKKNLNFAVTRSYAWEYPNYWSKTENELSFIIQQPACPSFFSVSAHVSR